MENEKKKVWLNVKVQPKRKYFNTVSINGYQIPWLENKVISTEYGIPYYSEKYVVMLFSGENSSNRPQINKIQIA